MSGKRQRKAHVYSDEQVERIRGAAVPMLDKLKRLSGWLEMCAESQDRQAASYRGQWESLADSASKDAKNFWATWRDVMECIALADPEWAAKSPNFVPRSLT